MNKKTIVIGIIVLIILATGAGLWGWKKNEAKKQEQSKIEQEETSIEKKEKSNDQQELQFPEDQLVWYEVPELGIKFKVTPDTKEDLKYFIENKKNTKTEYLVAYFYSESIKNFIEKNSKSEGNLLDNSVYSGKTISRVSKKDQKSNVDGRPWCWEDDVILNNDEYGFCLGFAQSIIFNSREQLEKWEETTKSKRFGEFFDTIQNID